MGYRIKTVAELTGIPRNTLLAWERRYGLVSPERQDNGFREYDDVDVARLRQLKALVDAGHPPGEAVSMLRARAAAPASAPTEADLVRSVRDGLISVARRFDRADADARVTALSAVPFVRQIDEVYFPFLREIGDRWAAGDISVAQEHFASGWVRDRFAAIVSILGFGRSGPLGTLLCACLPGEQHELGLMGEAIRCSLDGWHVVWLGANVPIEDLVDAIRRVAPDAVYLSATMPLDADLYRTWMSEIRAVAGASTRVSVGGAAAAALPEVPGVVRVVG